MASISVEISGSSIRPAAISAFTACLRKYLVGLTTIAPPSIRGRGDLEHLLRRRVSFKPLQSSVGGGKDGPGVRPTALGSFVFRTEKIGAQSAPVISSDRFCSRGFKDPPPTISKNARIFFAFHRLLSEHAARRSSRKNLGTAFG